MSPSAPAQTGPPPRRFRLGALLAVLAVGLLLGATGMWLLRPVRHEASAGPAGHERHEPPQASGEASGKAPGGTGPAHGRILYYRAPMNPKETSPTPRKDAMGMDYAPVYEEERSVETPIPGFATVRIDPERQQLIGLTSAKATRGPIGGSLRTVGRVAVDETRVRHINVKVGGFVEEIYVDFVGKPVARGQPLFSFYSPELLSVQTEYLLALDTRKKLAGGGGDVGGSGDELVTAARQRLKLWDVPDSEISDLERTRQPRKALTLLSPIRGVVTQKSIVQGMRLNPGDMPYEISDLGVVWVLADAYEPDLPRVHVGLPATFTSKGSGRAYEGRVAFIDPVLDPKTRTAKVRIAFANADGELRPEEFGEVVIRAHQREAIRIPADAIVNSGADQVVFISLGAGKFQPRKVTTGVSDGELIEATSGVQEGEAVVTRANFLVDSESRLKAALSGMVGSPGMPDSGMSP